MILTISTLIALNAMGSTVLEEKMAGNFRNKHLSFQAAEAGLRAAETTAAGLADNTLFVGTSGLYPRSKPGDVNGNPGVYATYPVWETIADSDWVDDAAIPDLTGTPEYIIEQFSVSPRDSSCALTPPIPPGCMLPVYRITSRAMGLNTNTVSIIQSTYKRL
jgi:type IV pilus assembly protein PilX